LSRVLFNNKLYICHCPLVQKYQIKEKRITTDFQAMEKKFISKALEANLAETRYRDIKIPTEYQAFIDISKKYYGIHKRANDCVIEYQHPFSNKKFVIEELRKILITDYWFYITPAQPKKTFRVPLQLLGNLLNDQQVNTYLKTFILRTLLEFAQKLYKEKKDFQETLLNCYQTLHESFAKNKKSYIEASRYFKRYAKEIATDDHFRSLVLQLTRNIYEAIIDFWENDSCVEDWIEQKRASLKIDKSLLIREIGKPYFEKLRYDLNRLESWQEMADTMPDFDQMGERFAQTIEFSPLLSKNSISFFTCSACRGCRTRKNDSFGDSTKCWYKL